MDKKLFLFTLNGCHHCEESKKILRNKKINFTELEITKYDVLWKEIIKQTEQDYVPTVFIQEDIDGSGIIFTPINDYSDVNEMIKLIESQIKEE